MRKFLLLSALFVCFGFTKSLAQCAVTTSSISGSSSVCANTNNVTYSVTNNSGSTYAWTITGGTPVASSTTNTITVNWGAAASGNVKVVETFTGGCVGTAVNLPIVINPKPITSSISGNTSVCQNLYIAYTVTGTAGSTYTWTATGGIPYTAYSCGGWGNPSTCYTNVAGTSITSNTVYVLWTGAGTGTLNVVETNAGCTGAPVSLQVSVQAPVAVSSPSPQLCVGATMQLSPSTGGTWSVVGSTTAASVTSSGALTGLANGVVTLAFVTPSGCTSTMSVTVGPPPSQSIQGPISVCVNQTNVTYTYPNTTGSTYAWTITGGTPVSPSTTNSISVNWGSAGSGNVKVVETNSSGCVGLPVNLAVIVSAISGRQSVCANTNGVTYSVINNSGSTYSWTITGGTAAAPSTTNSITVNWGAAGSGNVRVVETFAGGSVGTALNQAVTINALPVTSPILGKTDYCPNMYTDYYVTPTTGSTYVWTATGGTTYTESLPPVQIQNTPTEYRVRVAWRTLGTDYISVVETNSAGCTGPTISLPVSVVTFPSLSAPSNSLTCIGNTMQLSPSTGGTWTTSTPSTTSVTSSGLVTVVGYGQSCVNFTQDLTGVTGGLCSINFYAPTLSGPSSACLNTTSSYTFSGASSSNTFNWTITGGTQVSGGNTNSITVNWTSVGQGNIHVVESVGGASCAADLPVTINPKPSVSPVVGPSSVCLNSSANFTNTNSQDIVVNSWSITQPDGSVTYLNSWNQTTNGTILNYNFTSLGQNIITVSGYNSFACYSDPSSVSVNVVKTTTGTLTGPSSVCYKANTSYSVSGPSTSTYAWTVLGGTLVSGANTNNVTVNWTGNGLGNGNSPGTLTVVETSSLGCSGAPVSMNVTVVAPQTGTISGYTNNCLNSNSNYSVPPTIGSTYQWTVTGGTVASGQGTNTINVNWTTAGSGNVKVIETNSSGCVAAPVNFPVSVISLPNTSSIIGNPSSCVNTNGVAYNVSNSTGSSYNWTITGGNVASGQGTNAITVNWTVAGAGNVKVVETSTAGCVGTAVNKSVTVNALPVTSSITGLSSVCPNASGVAYSVTNTTGSTYAWTVTGTGSSLVNGNGTNAITVNWGSAGTGTVKVIETNVNGCVGVAVTKSVTVNALPNTSIITGAANACPNATGIAYSVTNTVNSTYNWNITGGSKASGGTSNAITVTWGIGGVGNVSVIETNAAGCVGTVVSKAVTVSPLTSPISGSVKVCPNSNCVAYSVTNVPGDTYTWTVTGGTLTCGQNTNIVIVNWGAAGSGTLSVTERSATCTGVAVNLPVAITASPATSAITGNSAVCPYATNSSYSVTNTAGSTYLWTVCGGIIASGNNTNSILVNWGANGPGNISVVETSSTGCIGTAVNKTVSITSITTGIITGSSSMCLPANGIIYSVPNTVGSSYAWTVNGGTVVSGAGTNSITVNWTLAGPGLVSVVETNSAGCVGNTVTQPVQVNPKPATPAITGNNSVCPNATGISYSVTNTPGSTYVWTISGGTPAAPSTTNSIAVNWGAVGTGNVNVVETNNFGCVGLPVNLPITINALPTITVTPASASIGYGGSVSLTASGASTYSWSPSTGLNTTTGATVIASPSATTTYTVSGTDSHGCVNTKTVPVSLTCTPPSVYISSSNGLNLCKFTSTTLTATPISGATYTWTSSAGDYSKTGTTTNGGNTLLVYDEETYTVSVNVSGCFGSASATIYRTGTNCVGIARVAAGSQPTKPTESEDGPKGHKISVHPNPANHEVIVETPKRAEQDTQVVLYDMMGRVSGSGILKKGEWQVTISTSEVANGMYVVRIGNGDQANAEKVIIEHK